jgi:hypothetical protein
VTSESESRQEPGEPETKRPSGLRVGPDPWPHRRGEPRVFAFLWTVYLLVGAMGTLASLGVLATVESYQYAARLLLVLMAIGVVGLWPMVRLSQVVPYRVPAPGQTARPETVRSRAGQILEDVLVVLLPIQAVIWPQVWLAAWSGEVLGAVDALICAWGVLVGGILALALGRASSGVGRAGWMAIIMALVLLAPALMLTGVDAPSIRTASPLTGIYEITRDRASEGLEASVSVEHWRMIGVTLGVGILIWGYIFVRGGGPGRRDRLD